MKPLYAALLATLIVTLASAPARAADWSGWYATDDGYKGLVRVRVLHSDIKNSRGAGDVQYQFLNGYGARASFDFEVLNEEKKLLATGREELGAGGRSWSGALVHPARRLWFVIKNLHAAGSRILLPAAN